MHAPRLLAYLTAALLPAQLDALPQRGVCENPSDFPIFDLVEWHGSEASVQKHGNTIPARVAGLRLHEPNGYRLSVFYDDPINGLIEIAIFDSDMVDDPRVAIIGYKTVDGENLAEYVQGYQDANCIVR